MTAQIIPLLAKRRRLPAVLPQRRPGQNRLREAVLGPYRLVAIPDIVQVLVREGLSPEARARALLVLDELYALLLSMPGTEARILGSLEEWEEYQRGGPLRYLGLQCSWSAFAQYAERLC